MSENPPRNILIGKKGAGGVVDNPKWVTQEEARRAEGEIGWIETPEDYKHSPTKTLKQRFTELTRKLKF